METIAMILVTLLISALYASMTMVSIRKEEERNKAIIRLVRSVIKTVETIDTTVDSLVELQQKMELRRKYPMPIDMEEITDETLRRHNED